MTLRYCLSVCVEMCARAQVASSTAVCTHAHTYTHANLVLARSKGERRPGRRPMCRTGSVSIRPDSCGLLYASQVLFFLFPSHLPPFSLSLSLSLSLVLFSSSRSFFHRLARSSRALCLSAACMTPLLLFLPHELILALT